MEPGRRVLIEERLEGEEFSLQTIADGKGFVHCPIAQDHKRAFDGDIGPNTGGMGSYSCQDFSLPFLNERYVCEARRINEAVLNALAEECARPYRGVLYGGFIATAGGTKLIEYNARFADPEALNILPILASDFVELAYSCATGTLSPESVRFESKATVCKYVVPNGYPNDPERGQPIHIPSEVFDNPDVRVYFAGVKQVGSEMHLTGSRAVALVGIGDTLDQAEQLAEAAAAAVVGPVRHRRDIGTRELVEARCRHMDSLCRRIAVPN